MREAQGFFLNTRVPTENFRFMSRNPKKDRHRITRTSRKATKLFRLWAKALGEKGSPHNGEADFIAAIRTFILLNYITTNAFIIAGVIRHWNK